MLTSLGGAKACVPFHFIVVDNELLLQHLDGIQIVRLFLFRQHDFTEISLSEHRKEVEVIQPDLPLSHRLRLSVRLLLNNLLLLLLGRLVLLWGWLLVLWLGRGGRHLLRRSLLWESRTRRILFLWWGKWFLKSSCQPPETHQHFEAYIIPPVPIIPGRGLLHDRLLLFKRERWGDGYPCTWRSCG